MDAYNTLSTRRSDTAECRAGRAWFYRQDALLKNYGVFALDGVTKYQSLWTHAAVSTFHPVFDSAGDAALRIHQSSFAFSNIKPTSPAAHNRGTLLQCVLWPLLLLPVLAAHL
ncbi:hypothetical protein GWK47_006145 [Chionoecetes opilio]|uniref:Uncharacterized protein n=1 Tax=Chionoecetes opilio TaxID=41210 RepID=A0A8J4YEY5_CHIOP|nr:hypothetical protein GWK47_006145 [Chionoecetes opilio]